MSTIEATLQQPQAGAATSSANYASEEARLAEINAMLGAACLSAAPLARCIAPMLVALDWFGAPRALRDALPADAATFGVEHLRELLAQQGFAGHVRPWTGDTLAALPVGSVLLDTETPCVYLGRLEGVHWWHDGTRVRQDVAPRAGDHVLQVERNPEHQPIDAPQAGLLNRLLNTARRELGGALFLSLVINVLTLAISLFTMTVYNTLIPSGATNTLWTFALGVAIAILGTWALRIMRLRALSDLSAWAGDRINRDAFQKMLRLPLDASARAGVDGNLGRLRSAEGVRQLLGGTSGVLNFDYPFVLVFLLVIALLGGWIVFVPLTGLLLFYLVSLPLARLIESRSARAGRVGRELHDTTSALTLRLRSLRGVRGSALLRQHLSELVIQAAKANRDHALANAVTQALGQALTMLTVLCTMAVGIALVLSEGMSTGGLIATMMLIWRVTTPAQQMFAARVRTRQVLAANTALERLMATQGEHQNPRATSPVTSLQASLTADRLYYRYSAEREPALSGVSFEVEAGQTVAVIGPNGAGKSTLLELLASIRQPQNGRLLVGGRDIRQFDPADYRTWLGYVPQVEHGLPLRVDEFLRLRLPNASDDALVLALAQVGGRGWWRLFGAESAEAALATRLEPWRRDRASQRARFVASMAAALVGKPSLLLLDDPLADRDPTLDAQFQELLTSLHGKTTVILATHRPDLIQRADLAVVLNEGNLVHAGPVGAPEPPATAEAPVAPNQA